MTNDHTCSCVSKRKRNPAISVRRASLLKWILSPCKVQSKFATFVGSHIQELRKHLSKEFLPPPSSRQDSLSPSSSPTLSQGFLPLRRLTTCFLSLECWYFSAGFLGDNDMAQGRKCLTFLLRPGPARPRLLIGASGPWEAWKQQSQDSSAPPCAGWACLGNDCGSGWSHCGWGRQSWLGQRALVALFKLYGTRDEVTFLLLNLSWLICESLSLLLELKCFFHGWSPEPSLR